MPHPIDTLVGKNLRHRRNELGLSQQELGKIVDVTFQQIQKYEAGVNRVSASRLWQFAEILRVPVGYFFSEEPKLVDRRIGARDRRVS